MIVTGLDTESDHFDQYELLIIFMYVYIFCCWPTVWLSYGPKYQKLQVLLFGCPAHRGQIAYSRDSLVLSAHAQ